MSDKISPAVLAEKSGFCLRLTDKADLVTLFDVPGKESKSKRQLISSAERCFGQNGIAGTSLLEIAEQAGQANKFAVQYHFGSKEGLIKAIFDLRLRVIDARRRQLLGIAADKGCLVDERVLLEILFLPIAEQVDQSGEHSYARFLLQFITRIDYDRELTHPLGLANDPMSAALHMIGGIIDLPPAVLRHWMYLQSLTLLGALNERDTASRLGASMVSLEEDLGEIMDISVETLKAVERRHQAVRAAGTKG